MSVDHRKSVSRRKWNSCLVLALIIAFTAAACTRAANDLEELTWMEGTWRGTTSTGTYFYERWTRDAASTMIGHGFEVADGDTVFGESLRIERRDGAVYYVADVAHNAAPVSFRLVEISDSRAVFENAKHDFPQRFIYERRGSGEKLYVRGETVDGSRKIEFRFEREG